MARLGDGKKVKKPRRRRRRRSKEEERRTKRLPDWNFLFVVKNEGLSRSQRTEDVLSSPLDLGRSVFFWEFGNYEKEGWEEDHLIVWIAIVGVCRNG